jgi:beta-glucosidase
MTLEEKVGQLNQLSPSIVGGFDLPFEELIEMMTEGRITQDEFGKIMAKAEMDYHEEEIRAGKIGSFLMNNPRKANELQKLAVEESRLGIPLIFGFDVIHGFQTIFPIPLAEACSWNEEVFEESAKIAAREARAHNIQWTFAPMVDISRDARWGRIAESPGEDPYLASLFARAKVRGFQGEKLDEGDNVAACLKHYVAYGAAEGGQDYNTVSMANNMLYNGYLPPFQAGIEEGAATVMGAFNDYNGVPCTVNQFLLRDILKQQYGFQGFVVSDANAIDDCVRHGIAADLKEASKLSCNAGMDMDMNSHAYSAYLKDQIEQGEVALEVLNDAVRRILRVKMAFGLFDNPYVSEEKMEMYEELPKEHVAAALDAAKRSIVLLKNEKVLPLKKDQKVALIGELADASAEVMGTWAIAGREKDCVSIHQGLKNAGVAVTYAKVCGVTSEFNQMELQQVAENADVIVAVVGETASMSGEASSKADISLPGEQQRMMEAALATGRPVVVVLINGRPLTIPWVEEKMPAIVEAWHLGSQMGNAVSEVLFGEYNPSGKLACTFPAMVGQCPRYYNHPNTGRPGAKSKFSSRYLDAPLKPLYPFGYGLSYTSFSYDNLSVEEMGDALQIRVDLINTGTYTGEETVQVYIRDVSASLVRPIKELKAFKKEVLNPGEKVAVQLEVKKDTLGFYDDEMNYRLENGVFEVMVGANSQEYLMSTIEVTF